MNASYPLKTKNILLKLFKFLLSVSLFLILFTILWTAHLYLFIALLKLFFDDLNNQFTMFIMIVPLLIYLYLSYKWTRKIVSYIQKPNDRLVLEDNKLTFLPFKYTFNFENTSIEFNEYRYFSADPESISGGNIHYNTGLTFKDNNRTLVVCISGITASQYDCDDLPNTNYSFKKKTSVKMLNESDFYELKEYLLKKYKIN